MIAKGGIMDKGMLLSFKEGTETIIPLDKFTEIKWTSAYSHNFSRMKQHLHAIIASSDEPFKTVEEANYYREKVKEAAQSALCYIPIEHDKHPSFTNCVIPEFKVGD